MTNKEKKELIELATAHIIKGKTKHFINQYLTKTIKLSNKTANSIYEAAINDIRANYTQDKDRQRDLITCRFENLYDKAYESGKFGICAGILREMAELQGLKTTNINLEANITDESIVQLTQVLQIIQITATEGIDGLLTKSINQFTDSVRPDSSSDS